MLREVTTQLMQNKWIIIILLRKETKNQLLNMVMLWVRNPAGRFRITCSETSLLLTLTQEPQKSVFVPVSQVTKAN